MHFPLRLCLTPLQAVIWAIFFRSVGYFLLIGLWAIMFLEPPFSFQPSQIALLLGTFAFADRGMGIFWAALLPKLGFRNGLLLGYGLSLVSLFAILVHQGFLYCFFMFLLFGVGMSLSNLSARLWLSTSEDEQQRLQHFSSFYRTINLGAGIAPVIGFALPYQTHPMLIVFGVVCAFALCFLCISLFFATEVEPTRSHLPFLKLVTAMYHQIGKRLGVFSVFATFGLGVYALTHAHALAFYFKTFFTIPPFMGVLLAVNPILIVIFQKQLSQGFFRLHQKIPQSGFLVGMGFMVCGFLTMALGRSPHAAWGFILFATLGEMLIYPHIDFVLSQKVPRFLMPYLLAMLGLTMAVAQSLADSSAITALSLSAAWQLPPQTWWIVNTIAYAGITGFGIFLLRRRRGHVETTV